MMPRRDPPRACASRMTESDDALERAGPWLFAAAVALGAWLRLDQFTAQVLIDDEWHAVHQLLKLTPSQMWLDFGHADYSIPLGLLYGLEARAFGLTETAMRWPMLVGGLATLVLFPLYVARRLGRATAAVFALLLAISPLLVIYSRMARPYAITLFLAWSAHAAFHRFDAAPRGRVAAGAAYAVAAALAAWLHPIIAPFVVAPFFRAGFDLLRDVPERRARAAPQAHRARPRRRCADGDAAPAAAPLASRVVGSQGGRRSSGPRYADRGLVRVVRDAIDRGGARLRARSPRSARARSGMHCRSRAPACWASCSRSPRCSRRASAGATTR